MLPRLAVVAFVAVMAAHPAAARRAAAARPVNVLFIAVDDLRPELGCYGQEWIHTPHIDRLAGQGRLFRRHYVQVPTCGASRCALLRGRYPRSRQDLSNDAIRRHMAGNEEPAQPESFAHHFRRGGYTTICLGKISHYPDGRLFAYDHTGSGELEMPHSWDEVGLPYGPWKNGWDAFFGYAGGAGRVQGRSPPIESANVPDDGYPDGLIAAAAIEALQKQQQQLEADGGPFLMCVGFFKPHLPFCAPQKYFDLYDLEEIPPPANPESPTGVNPRSVRQSGEPFGNYRHDSENPREDVENHRRLRQAYFACVSYVDVQIGRVLDELDRLGMADNTVVVVWGDHGWHLGEHHLWGKHTTFERALHSPLIVRTPGMKAPGEPSDGLVETVDLYPTLTQLCGLTTPDDLDGESLVPLLEDPSHAGKQAAHGFWHGRTTVRTNRYRLVAYTEEQTAVPQFELFDHQRDPLETVNVADEHPDMVERLRSLLAERQIR